MSRRLPCLVASLAGLLVLAGGVAFALANRPRDVVYEGSYAPLEAVEAPYSSSLSLTFDDGWSVTWTGGHLLGAGLILLGLLGLAALGGWALGRHASRGDKRG